MRFLTNYFRQCFCKHDFKKSYSIASYAHATDTLPSHYKQLYVCKKCGYVYKVKVY